MDEVVKLMFSIASVWNAPLGENMLRVSPDIALLVANFPSIRGGGCNCRSVYKLDWLIKVYLDKNTTVVIGNAGITVVNITLCNHDDLVFFTFKYTIILLPKSGKWI